MGVSKCDRMPFIYRPDVIFLSLKAIKENNIKFLVPNQHRKDMLNFVEKLIYSKYTLQILFLQTKEHLKESKEKSTKQRFCSFLPFFMYISLDKTRRYMNLIKSVEFINSVRHTHKKLSNQLQRFPSNTLNLPTDKYKLHKNKRLYEMFCYQKLKLNTL